MTYDEELKDIKYASKCLYPELSYLIERFQKDAVITQNINSNSLSDFLGWMTLKTETR